MQVLGLVLVPEREQLELSELAVQELLVEALQAAVQVAEAPLAMG